MKPSITILAGIAIILIGCATHPGSIRPAYVSERHYENWTCDQISAEYVEVFDRFELAYEHQKRESDADALGVFLIGIPVGEMGLENLETQIAQYRGMLATIERINERRRCGIQPVKIPYQATAAEVGVPVASPRKKSCASKTGNRRKQCRRERDGR